MTIDEAAVKLRNSKKGVTNDEEWCNRVADILVEIGNESLNPNNLTGDYVGYCGVSLEEYAVRDNCMPFHKYDMRVKDWIPDPAVRMIGDLVNQIGNMSYQGFEYMQHVYYAVGKKFHGRTSLLEEAWNGIGNWMC